ncbi:zinc finger CCHC domain-containing protein 3-like [Huso huso]|uniref:Zinc finger CCHC domain-containing protein 3-like n=1 Tax=Huso huso TaxID=61971 RepID=A0ABR0YGI7_HUSHU
MAATAGVRRFNVLRFNWSDKKEVSLSRLDFSRQILQRLLEVKPEDLNCLIKLPGIAVSFDVSFVSNGAMEKCLEVYNKKKKDAPLSQFLVEPLSDREIKVVTIQFYSEVVNDYDIETWLHRHCKVKSRSRKVKDADGVWNGARQWLIQLHEDPNGINGVRHLPSNFSLGTTRGFVMYYGMPKLCRNCGGWGHLAVACKVVKCKNCGGAHISSLCTEEKKCNLCGKEGHVFKMCPDLFTNVVKMQRVPRSTGGGGGGRSRGAASGGTCGGGERGRSGEAGKQRAAVW